MSDPAIEVSIVIARCVQSKQPYGIRFQQDFVGKWTATWAFKRGERWLLKPRESSQHLTGGVALGETFPGCPHCGGGSFVRCGHCEAVGCWDKQTDPYPCPHCGRSAPIGGRIESLNASQDG